MVTPVAPTSHYGTTTQRFAEDGAQLSSTERKNLGPVKGDLYLTKGGVKTEITTPAQLADAIALTKGSGTVIFKKPPTQKPGLVDLGPTVYYQKGNNIDVLMDGGYHKGGVQTQYTESDKDDLQGIISSKDAMGRYQHDMREDTSAEQRGGVNTTLNNLAKSTTQITLQEAETTLLQMSKSKTLTYDYMMSHFDKLDNNDNRTPQEQKEHSALARVLFDKASAKSIDRGAIIGTFTTAELVADLKRLNNGAI